MALLVQPSPLVLNEGAFKMLLWKSTLERTDSLKVTNSELGDVPAVKADSSQKLPLWEHPTSMAAARIQLPGCDVEELSRL